MASKTYSKSLNQQERAFWRDAFKAAAKGVAHPRQRSASRAAQYCADFADSAIAHYRERVLWRNS